MNYKEIYQKVKDKFPDAVAEICEVVGDSFAVIKRENIQDVCKFLRDESSLTFDFPTCVSGVDDGTTFWVVYHLYSTKKNHRIVLKVNVGRDNPSVPTVMDIWRGANGHERETFDMYGIKFEGHSDLRRILLPDDWDGWPLRKDYEFPDSYHDIPLK